MARLLFWLVGVELTFVGFGLLSAAALGMEKRSRFGARVALACLVMLWVVLLAAGTVAVGVLRENMLGPLWLLLAVTALGLGPACCYRRAASAPGSSDTGWGPGSGPGPPPSRPDRPLGGIPLPDADQSSERVRDHHRPRLGDARPRRQEREPDHGPTPANR